MNKSFDVVVIGLGAMGSAALFQLSKSSHSVLGVDQFSPPHNLGSSHGHTRITRQGIGEGKHYCKLAMRSHEIWGELEELTGMKLFEQCGLLLFDSEGSAIHQKEDFFQATVNAASEFGIEHELLDNKGLRKRFSQFSFCDRDKGYFERGAGYLFPERCIEAQLGLAETRGAKVLRNSKVLSLKSLRGGKAVQIDLGDKEIEASKVILTAGPWVREFLEEGYCSHFKIYRQTLFWFQPADSAFDLSGLPAFIRLGADGESFYGFPMVSGDIPGIKVATGEYLDECTPEKIEREVGCDEHKELYSIVEKILPLQAPPVRSVTCMYTVTPDSDFIIDSHPTIPNVLLCSACSGHGFKHSAAIGESLASSVLGANPRVDLEPFSLARFNTS